MTYYTGDPNKPWPLGLSKRPPDYRKEQPAKFGSEDYNPEITTYYGDAAGNEVVRIEERLRQDDDSISLFAQTISGTTYSGVAWPLYDHYVIETMWSQTTYSG